jgi:5-methyltetrahydropteroyltriglutamate--homocysteine methyltransferase
MEERAIISVLAAQERHGLALVTDGEYRRRDARPAPGATTDVAPGKAGDAPSGPDEPHDQLAEVVAAPMVASDENGPGLRCTHNLLREEYRFAASRTEQPVKVGLLGPERLRHKLRATEPTVPLNGDPDEKLADLVADCREVIAGVVGLGAAHVQVNSPTYACYGEAASLAEMRGRGHDPLFSLERSVFIDNAMIEGFPGVQFSLHICGASRPYGAMPGGFHDALAERLFADLTYDRFLVACDPRQLGWCRWLRYVPKDKTIVLGLVSTDAGHLESLDDLLDAVDQASRHVAIDRLALSPACGFTSSPGSSRRRDQVAEDWQWRKIDLLLETAARVWPTDATPE